MENKEKEYSFIFTDPTIHSNHQNTLEKLPSELTMNYKFIKKLGQGTYSYAFEVFDKIHETTIALKYNKEKSNFEEEEMRELRTLKKLSHPNIIPHYHSAICSKTKKFYMLTELCDMNLKEFIESRPSLNMLKKMEILKQICEAIDYLHNENPLKVISYS